MVHVGEVQFIPRWVKVERNDIVKVIQGRDDDVSEVRCGQWYATDAISHCHQQVSLRHYKGKYIDRCRTQVDA